MEKRYIRTCQECGHVQTAKNPADYTGKGFMEETWRDTKCRKCKSPALDYGSFEQTPEEKKQEEEEIDDLFDRSDWPPEKKRD